jgi:hypothetical protein
MTCAAAGIAIPTHMAASSTGIMESSLHCLSPQGIGSIRLSIRAATRHMNDDLKRLSRAFPFLPSPARLPENAREQFFADVAFVGFGIDTVISPLTMNACFPPE